MTFLASLLLCGVSFFVKKKRKENRIISQIEIIVRVLNLIRILSGGRKRTLKKINYFSYFNYKKLFIFAVSLRGVRFSKRAEIIPIEPVR